MRTDPEPGADLEQDLTCPMSFLSPTKRERMIENSMLKQSSLEQDRKRLKMTEPIVPHENDILMGRGGKNNQHVGNEKLREMARLQSENYRQSAKKGKSFISRELVRRVREMTPPGRFLKKNGITGDWEDVGDEVAREKASQVLRDAVASLMNTGENDGGCSIESAVETEHRRCSSAPARMGKHHSDWDVCNYKHNTKTPQQFSSALPVSPVCSSAAKRPRYTTSETKTWEPDPSPKQDDTRNQPIPSSMPSSSVTQFVSPASAQEGLLGDIQSTINNEFDLFDGELLESNDPSRKGPESS